MTRHDKFFPLAEKAFAVLVAAGVSACSLRAVAAGEGVAAETARIQAEIDRVSRAGGGRVSVAPGDHHIGSLLLRSGVELHLEKGARLVGSRDPDDYNIDFSGTGLAGYVTNSWGNAMIRIANAHDVAVTGEEGSEIYGRNCYNPKGEEGFRGPHAITAYGVSNLELRGYRVRDAGNFGIYARFCTNVTAVGVQVDGGHDGFDFFSSRNVLIEKCRIFSGDDCVAGHGNAGLTVRDCELNTACSMFRLGGNDVLIENCRGEAPGRNPHRWTLTTAQKQLEVTPEGAGRRTTLSVLTYFSSAKRLLPATNVVFRNCRFSGVERVLHYNLSGTERWQKGRGLADLTLENVSADGILEPLVAYCDPTAPLSLKVKGCSFAFRGEVPAFIKGANIGAIEVEGTSVKGVSGPLLLNWKGDAPRVDLRDSNGLEPETKQATERFTCRNI